jgi:5-formyltetrahydrofolate cyclo-ligase
MGPREIDEAAEQALRARAKQELRGRMRALRRVIPQAACAARSSALCTRLCELPAFTQASTVIGYTAYNKEADPTAALLVAAASGKSVGLVRVEEHGALGLHAYAEGDLLEPNQLGILEPSASASRIPPEDVSLIIVPALAVAASGHRIGYGQGYYDRLLPRLVHAFKVAIAYDFQLLAEIPCTHDDVPVDCVLTDKRVLMVNER